MTRHMQIAQRAFNTPLLFDPAKAQAFLMGLGARVLGGRLVLPSVDVPEDRVARASRTAPRVSIIDGSVGRRRRERGDRLYPVIDGVAVIDVTGSLVHRGSWVGESSGATSYEGLHAQIEALAADSSVRGVALEVDSFGGEAAGCFDLADHLRSLRATKPVWAFVAEHAFSGGYAIASQADRIILPRTGEVGSIGVLSMHVDYSAALEADGIQVTLIQSGKKKTDGHPYGPLPDHVLEEWQARADDMRQIFAETVAAGRDGRLSAAAALATEAGCFMGPDAVAAGLADEVADLRGAFAAFVEKVNGRAAVMSIGTVVGAPEKETVMSGNPNPAKVEAETAADPAVVTPVEEEQTPAEPAAADPAEPQAAAPAATSAQVAGASISVAQATALADVAAQASALGVKVDLASAFRDGVSASDLQASVLSQLAARSEQTAVSVTHPVKVAAESPIVAAAKKAAAAAKSAGQ